MNHFEIRRQILFRLYDDYKRYPSKGVERRELMDYIGIEEINEFSWNMKYLCQKDYAKYHEYEKVGDVELNWYYITVKGVDLVENEKKFDKAFPPEE